MADDVAGDTDGEQTRKLLGRCRDEAQASLLATHIIMKALRRAAPLVSDLIAKDLRQEIAAEPNSNATWFLRNLLSLAEGSAPPHPDAP